MCDKFPMPANSMGGGLADRREATNGTPERTIGQVAPVDAAWRARQHSGDRRNAWGGQAAQ
jgi:hypothetical protein